VDHNPVILVNDWLSGIYLFNLRTAKTASLEPRDHKYANDFFYDFRLSNDNEGLSSGSDGNFEGDGDQEEESSSFSDDSSASDADSNKFTESAATQAKKARLLAKTRKKKFQMMRLQNGASAANGSE